MIGLKLFNTSKGWWTRVLRKRLIYCYFRALNDAHTQEGTDYILSVFPFYEDKLKAGLLKMILSRKYSIWIFFSIGAILETVNRCETDGFSFHGHLFLLPLDYCSRRCTSSSRWTYRIRCTWFVRCTCCSIKSSFLRARRCSSSSFACTYLNTKIVLLNRLFFFFLESQSRSNSRSKYLSSQSCIDLHIKWFLSSTYSTNGCHRTLHI